MDKKQIKITLPKPFVEALDSLVEEGIYMDRQEIIREALRKLIKQHGIEPFVSPLKEID